MGRMGGASTATITRTASDGDELADLLRRSADGDAAARGRLFERTADRLRAVARRHLAGFPRVARWEQSGDVAQEATVRLLKALDDVRPTTAAAYFGLFALQLRRELVNRHRAAYGPLGRFRLYASPTGEDRRPPEFPCDGDDDPAGGFDPAAVRDAVAALPAQLRQIVDLRFYAGLTEGQAGEALGESRRTISRRWAAAKVRLAERLCDE